MLRVHRVGAGGIKRADTRCRCSRHKRDDTQLRLVALTQISVTGSSSIMTSSWLHIAGDFRICSFVVKVCHAIVHTITAHQEHLQLEGALLELHFQVVAVVDLGKHGVGREGQDCVVHLVQRTCVLVHQVVAQKHL